MGDGTLVRHSGFTWHRLTGLLIAILIVVAVAACGGQEAAPTATPTLIPDGTTSGTTAPTGFEQEWEALVEAAKAEGELVISLGRAPSRMYGPLYDYFGKTFGIRMVVGGGSGSQTADRILAERNGGQYTVDIIGTGANTATGRLIPGGVLDPLGPELFHPEVVDESLWYRGRHWWADAEQKLYFAYAGSVSSPPIEMRYNTNLVTPEDIAAIDSVWDYLDPKWKGKIVAVPPTSFGSLESYVSAVVHPDIGQEWVERFITEMDVNWLEDYRLVTDGLAKGKYAMAIFVGSAGSDIDDLGEQGLPVALFDGEVEERGNMSLSGVGLIGVANQRPHPNAAKLFVNWLLSKEGQMKRQELAELPTVSTLREDMDLNYGNVDPADRREPGTVYPFPSADPEVTAKRPELQEQVQELYRSSR